MDVIRAKGGKCTCCPNGPERGVGAEASHWTTTTTNNTKKKKRLTLKWQGAPLTDEEEPAQVPKAGTRRSEAPD